MKHGEATGAVVKARLRTHAGFAASAIAGCALAGALLAPAQICSGAILFGALCGISAALLNRDPATRELELCEQSAPLYGRELARARAIVPCAIALAALLAFWLATLRFSVPSGACVTLSFAVCVAATLTALCATLRRGRSAALYVALAVLLATAALSIHSNRLPAMLLAALLYTTIAFTALRQYGEALARYDPIDL